MEHATSLFRIGTLTVDLGARTAKADGVLLHLTPKELAVLELLMLRRGTTVTKEMFLKYLYAGTTNEPEIKIIDVFVCKLRKKLADATGNNNLIKTIWGRGYILAGDKFGAAETGITARVERAEIYQVVSDAAASEMPPTLGGRALRSGSPS